jgi:hypothetical protein
MICIRGLKAFKKGCPEHCGPGGCPAWIEREVPNKNGGTEKVAECLDLFMARMTWHTNAILQGNQKAIESFRNGMVAKSGSTTMPKPAIGSAELLAAIKPLSELADAIMNRAQLKEEVRKAIEAGD